MKDPNLLILIHIFICMIFAIVLHIGKSDTKFLDKVSKIYLGLALFVISYIITDTLLAFIYTLVFAGVIVMTIHQSNKTFTVKDTVIYLILVAISSTLMIFILKFVLVKILSILMVYILPVIYIIKQNQKQPFKDRLMATLGLMIIFASSLLYYSGSLHDNPNKQSFTTQAYFQENYEANISSIWSRDAMRGQDTRVTVYFDNDQKMYFIYKNGVIESVDHAE